jgi:hypothetical protein
MSDPLSLLRKATIAKQVIPFVDGHYDFGIVRLAGDVKTCFKRTLRGSTIPLHYCVIG